MRNRMFRLIGSLTIVSVVLGFLAAGPASAANSPILCALSGSGPGTLTAPASGSQQAPAFTPVAQPGQAYIHTSTAYNVGGDSTYLENPALNEQPTTKFFAIENAQPYNFGVLAATAPLGVWYDNGVHRWAIYNDDSSVMAQRLSWNVFIPPQDATLILHDSAGLNSSGPETKIDDLQFNGDPNAVIFVQHVFNPGSPAAGDSPTGAPNNYFTKTVGVSYDTGAGRWAIRNEDGTNFQFGKTFFVLRASPDETFFIQTVTPANNIAPHVTMLDSPLLNGNPDAQILVTQNFGPGLVANNHEVGVGYLSAYQHWFIFNKDAAPMPLGAMFNVLVIPPKTGYLLHTATPANIIGAGTFISNTDLNNNPNALIYVSHNWNPPELDNEILNPHPIGVIYVNGGWFIVNLDNAPMTPNLTFNVYYTLPRGNSFSVSASFTNASGSSMIMNSPQLNSNPSAVPIISANLSPAGQPPTSVYTEPVGLRYYSPLSAWQVFNNSGPSFVFTQTENVLVAPGSFVVTATAPFGDYFTIDNPLTNNNPWAMVFASARDSSGINEKNVGVYYTGQKWAIYNEDATCMSVGVVYDVFVTRFRAYLPAMYR